MNNPTDPKADMKNQVLDEDTLELLSRSPQQLDLQSEKIQSLRSKVMAQVEKDGSPGFIDLLTIRADEDGWVEFDEAIKKKVLHVNRESGIESFLLRVEPGAKQSSHIHTSDEHCLVLEGDITFGDLHLHAGDYHLAPKGSFHEEAYSVHGALLFLQTGIEQQTAI